MFAVIYSYWPVLDDTLRRIAFENKTTVKLLASHWNETEPIMFNYLKSLREFSDRIDVVSVCCISIAQLMACIFLQYSLFPPLTV